MIKVPTLRMGGGKPMEDLYAVWESDPVTALQALGKAVSLTGDQIPETVAELNESVLRGLGLEKGGVGHVITHT